MEKLNSTYLAQTIENLFVMQECAIHALDDPSRVESGKKLLVLVHSKMSALVDDFSDLVEEEGE